MQVSRIFSLLVAVALAVARQAAAVALAGIWR